MEKSQRFTIHNFNKFKFFHNFRQELPRHFTLLNKYKIYTENLCTVSLSTADVIMTSSKMTLSAEGSTKIKPLQYEKQDSCWKNFVIEIWQIGEIGISHFSMKNYKFGLVELDRRVGSGRRRSMRMLLCSSH